MEKHDIAGQATDNNMVHAHCMLNTLGYKTHNQNIYIILIALPLQQWLQDRTLLLRYMYIAGFVEV